MTRTGTVSAHGQGSVTVLVAVLQAGAEAKKNQKKTRTTLCAGCSRVEVSIATAFPVLMPSRHALLRGMPKQMKTCRKEYNAYPSDISLTCCIINEFFKRVERFGNTWAKLVQQLWPQNGFITKIRDKNNIKKKREKEKKKTKEKFRQILLQN